MKNRDRRQIRHPEDDILDGLRGYLWISNKLEKVVEYSIFDFGRELIDRVFTPVPQSTSRDTALFRAAASNSSAVSSRQSRITSAENSSGWSIGLPNYTIITIPEEPHQETSTSLGVNAIPFNEAK